MSQAVLDLFADGRLLTQGEFERLKVLLAQGNVRGDEVAGWLIRAGVFSQTASRTLDLVAKGFISRPDPAMLLAPGGLEKLKLEVAPPKPAADPKPKPTPTPPVQTVRPVPVPERIVPQSPRTTQSQLSVSVATPRMPPGGVARVQPVASSSTASLSGVVRFGSLSHAVGVGSNVGKCLLTGVIGQGGHGMVYSALHQTLNIPVAVKVLLGEVEELNPEMVRQLRREAQLLARLNHPNVIRVLDFDLVPVPHVVLEYAEGPSLADLIAQTGGLWVPRAADIFLQVARGLAAAWELRVVHRDIKPGNILMAKNGVAKIADLGLALTPVSGSRLVETRQVVGTCAYMAPEQARTAYDVDFRADLYSLGATLYHCVTGQLPFQAKSAREYLLKHAAEALVPPHVAAPDRVDAVTSEIICRMMAKDPDDRYRSYEELISLLEGLPSQRSQATARMTPPGNGTNAQSRQSVVRQIR